MREAQPLPLVGGGAVSCWGGQAAGALGPAPPGLLPTVNRQPHVCSAFPPGSRRRMYKDHFYEPGLSRIRVHMHTFLLQTFPPPVFHHSSSPVFHHCSSTSHFSSLKPLRQHCNLWREARRGCKISEWHRNVKQPPLPRGQGMQVTGRAVKQPR